MSTGLLTPPTLNVGLLYEFRKSDSEIPMGGILDKRAGECRNSQRSGQDPIRDSIEVPKGQIEFATHGPHQVMNPLEHGDMGMVHVGEADEDIADT